MSVSDHPLSKLMIENFIKGFEEAKESIRGVQAQVHANEIQSAAMREKINTINEGVLEIKTLIRGNNGKDSIIDRIHYLEGEQKFLNKFVDEYKESKKEGLRGRWQMKGVWIASSVGLLSGIGAAIISLLGH